MRSFELDEVAALPLADGADTAAQLDRQLEVARVVGEVGDDVVAARVASGSPGNARPGQAVVADRREQPQRVPALAPRCRQRVGRFEDRELPALLGEQVANRQAGVAAADDDHLAPVACRVSGHVLGASSSAGVTLKLNIIPLVGERAGASGSRVVSRGE